MNDSKTLFLLRHAKSDWNAAFERDWQRPLNKRGQQNLSVMADKLKRRGVNPDIILCSDALRAQQTIVGIAQYLNFADEQIMFKPEMYHAGVNQLMAQISAQSDTTNTLMLVGHNPTLTILAQHLCDINTSNLPTCACVAIGFNSPSWQTIDHQSGTLLFFEHPKKIARIIIRGCDSYLQLPKKPVK